MTLVDEVVAAHGGLERWRRTSSLSLRLSSGGLAFATKGQPHALQDITATIATTGQHMALQGAGWAHEFHGDIPQLRGLRWSTADIAAFAAAALWTYVAVPFLLPELDVEERDRRLIVRFPPKLRTHCRRQVLHVDERGLIWRHDYTARDFGRWARASQRVGDYREFDGVMVATRRRVYPRLWPHRPLLVWIDVHAAAAVGG